MAAPAAAAGTRTGVRGLSSQAGPTEAGAHGRAPSLLRVAALIAFILPALGAHPTHAMNCVPDGSELERNLCATRDAERAEEELATALQDARARNAHDPVALEALARAHAAWQAFRDAALAAAFPCPHDDITVCFGPSTPRCHARLAARLARERAAHLAERPQPGPDGLRCD